MKIFRQLVCLAMLYWNATYVSAQSDKQVLMNSNLLDTAKKNAPVIAPKEISVKKDTVAPKIKMHDPRIATRRSAILPGWGQAYNREYWKIPLVYVAIGIPAALYIYNNNYYHKTKFAYEARFKQMNGDSSAVPMIDPQLAGLSITSLQNYRNEFRRDRDYCVLFFLLAWGLQVADATVFAHLKQFDVGNDLSLNVSPSFNPQTGTPAVGLTLNLKTPVHKTVNTR